MNYCRECGKIVEDDQKFCSYCGTEVNKAVDVENQVNLTKETEDNYMEDSQADYTEKQSQSTFSTGGNQGNTGMNPYGSQQIIEPLSNWVKVSLSVIAAIIPGLGPLIGIICSIIFMTSEDEDRKTFGYALLTFSIIFIVLLCICFAVFAVIGSENSDFGY